MIFEALKTVAACHAQNVIHGDIKPANFLLRQFHQDPVAFLEANEATGAWLKSVDFGCSQVSSAPCNTCRARSLCGALTCVIRCILHACLDFEGVRR